MVKDTCIGRNLLNHVKQIKCFSNVNVNTIDYNSFQGDTSTCLNYDSIKNPNTSYISIVDYDTNRFICAGSSKMRAIDAVIDSSRNFLSSYL